MSIIAHLCWWGYPGSCCVDSIFTSVALGWDLSAKDPGVYFFFESLYDRLVCVLFCLFLFIWVGHQFGRFCAVQLLVWVGC